VSESVILGLSGVTEQSKVGCRYLTISRGWLAPASWFTLQNDLQAEAILPRRLYLIHCIVTGKNSIEESPILVFIPSFPPVWVPYC